MARASRRADEIGKAVDEAEAGVRARRAELAATYRQHAETAILNFDFATAAEKYGAAYLQAVKFDPGLAYVMKLNQADAELDHGTYSGDKAALEASVLSYQSALDGAPRSIDRVQLAMAASNLGNALVILGERETDTRHLEEAARAYGSALKVLTRKRYPRIGRAPSSTLAMSITPRHTRRRNRRSQEIGRSLSRGDQRPAPG